MKNTIRTLLICTVSCTSVLSACSGEDISNNAAPDAPQYTLIESFELYLQSNDIPGNVLYFTADHYNSDDKTQAFAFVGSDGTGDLWYTDSKTTERLAESITAAEAPTVVATSSKPLYIIDGTTADGVTQSYAYIVLDGKPIRLDRSGEDLTSMGGDDFCTIVSRADRKLSSGELTGESYKKYYLYFDGNALKEYGGIFISETEFLRLGKSDTILAGIAECGYTVTEIIYRANGLININCEKTADNETVYENLTVKVIGNNCICIPSGQAQDADYVGRSTYGGKYELAAFPEGAVYPDGFKAE